MPEGPALYGVWCVLVQVASRCTPRGSLVRDGGQPHTPQSLSTKTGFARELIEKCLTVITSSEIDWIECLEGAALPQEGAALPQEGAALPQEGAALPQEGAVLGAATSQVARARNERTNEQDGQEEQEKYSSSQRGPAFGEFPLTFRAVCRRFPTADVVLVHRIVEAAAVSYVSVSNPKIPEPTDAVYSEAVEVAAGQSKKQTSAALFLKTVPAVIGNWAKCGKSNGSEPKLMFK